MFDSLKTLQTFDIGRRFHSEQSGPHYARLFHKNIVVHDTGDRARMANLLRELESSMEPFVRERGEASKYEPRPTKFSGLTREYAREAEIRMRRKLWAYEPNSRLTPRQRVENYEHLRSSGLSGRQWIRESPEVRSGWATLLPHPPNPYEWDRMSTSEQFSFMFARPEP